MGIDVANFINFQYPLSRLDYKRQANHGSKGSQRANMHKTASLTASKLTVGFEEQEKKLQIQRQYSDKRQQEKEKEQNKKSTSKISLLTLGVSIVDQVLRWTDLIYSDISISGYIVYIIFNSIE